MSTIVNKKFEVQTNTICGGWVNCWHENEQLLYFISHEKAQEAIDDFIETMEMGVAEGYLSIANTPDDYKIVEVEL